MSTMAATAHSSTPSDGPQLGLRERKKIKTRIAIRDATYELIQEQGYDATTIEQIAERAEVSPSTVFRYFPTKEDIVLTDEYDPVMEKELPARPADEPWTESLRYAVHQAIGFGFTEEPTRVPAADPADGRRARGALPDDGEHVGHRPHAVPGHRGRTGRDPDSLEVRVFAMSLIGGLMETSLYWAENGHQDDFGDLVDRALDVLENGLPPENPEATDASGVTS